MIFLHKNFRQKFSALLGVVFCLIFFSSFISVLAFETNPNPPATELSGGAYTNWLQETLENPPATDKNPLAEKDAVKKSNAISSEKGEKSAVVNGENLGIGISTPQQLLDIRGENGSIFLKSLTENAKILFSGNVGIFLQSKNFFLGNTTQKIEILSNAINVPFVLKLENKNAVQGAQQCPQGQKILGTDTEGKIICGEGGGAPLLFCNSNDQVPTGDIRPVGLCIVGEGGRTLPYCTFEDYFKRLDSCITKDTINSSLILDFSGTKTFDGTYHFELE